MINIKPLVGPWYVRHAGPGFPGDNAMTPIFHLPSDVVGVSDALTKLATPVRNTIGLMLSLIQDEVPHLTMAFTVDGFWNIRHD